MGNAHDKQQPARQPSAVKPAQAKQPVALKRLQGKDLKTQQRLLSPSGEGDTLRQAALGTSGAGGAMPHADKIQKSFGRFDVTGVRHHADGPAAESTQALGAQAYTSGNHVVSASGAPDLHTAAHEAAHVVQQRAGVAPSGGVGKPGDAHEQQADAVAAAVVRGESAEPLLARAVGNSAAKGGQAVQAKAVQFIGTPLNQDLKPTDATPAFGEDQGHQRRYSPEQYVEMWEKEQGRKMTPEERTTLDRGCIGITAANLAGGGNPLNYAEKVFGSFEPAHALMKEKNAALERKPGAGSARYVVFAKLFWSNQSEDPAARVNADDKAFLPDPKTGEVDMSGYQYKARVKADLSGGYVNFDYGFWDDACNCFWHANHMQYKDPAKRAADPMKVLQSTREKFVKGYYDFDRIIFGVALANNYDPIKAAMAYAPGGGG